MPKKVAPLNAQELLAHDNDYKLSLYHMYVRNLLNLATNISDLTLFSILLSL